MYIKQTANTLRTFGECFLNTYEIGCETPRNSPRPPRNWLRNTPSIPHVHHEIGCEHSANSPRPPRNLKRNTPSIPHVHHEVGCETPRQFPTSTTKLVAKHSVRRRGPIHRACPEIANCTYSHYQIRVYSLSNKHIHIIKYVFSSHHAHIFALPYQYIRFLLSIILNIKQPNTAYIYT